MEASRRAGHDDVARIAELARAMRAELRAMRGGAIWAEREALAEPLNDAYEALLDRDDACLVVGTIDDVTVGFGALVVDMLHDGARLGVVTDLFVDEGARSVGVGEPPRCRWPSTVTRVSNPVSASTFRASASPMPRFASCTWPNASVSDAAPASSSSSGMCAPSATTMMLKSLPAPRRR